LQKNELFCARKTTLIKSSRNSFRKFKIQVLFIKSDIVPSSSTANALMPTLIQLSNHFWNSIVGIAIRAVFDFSITSFRLLKRVPRNGFLTRSNRKIAGSHIRWIRWLLDGIYFVLDQKFTDNDGIVRRCVIMVQIQLHF